MNIVCQTHLLRNYIDIRAEMNLLSSRQRLPRSRRRRPVDVLIYES